ncbi:MAG: pentapeptide repeat-containing protein [Synechococcales cyanobacterium RU_4_20]|nr:pentapeptide repeat-containing protein [Synechococcales cyanobacterium RU_4_20]NJR69712.1 pentapeptide repeat-containing protein [Synechococcales cyanobacterium CRU_2_2]
MSLCTWPAESLDGINLAAPEGTAGVYLSSIQLPRASLREANLQGAELRVANLQGADFWEANLQGANLGGANLQGANLSAANLQDADLPGANLQNAILLGADLRTASELSPEQLQGEKPPLLCGTALPEALSQIEADRDCDRAERHLIQNRNWDSEAAKSEVDRLRNKQWPPLPAATQAPKPEQPKSIDRQGP